MKNTDNLSIVGKIGSTYGIKGWIKIRAFTEFGNSILEYSPLLLIDDYNNQITVEVEAERIHANVLIAKFKGINTPEEARQLTGRKIAISHSQLPELKKDEYYWSDLVGLTVMNKNGEPLGKVSYLMATGTNDVLVVKGMKEHAIPYLPGSVILNIDLNKQEIQVDWEVI